MTQNLRMWCACVGGRTALAVAPPSFDGAAAFALAVAAAAAVTNPRTSLPGRLHYQFLSMKRTNLEVYVHNPTCGLKPIQLIRETSIWTEDNTANPGEVCL